MALPSNQSFKDALNDTVNDQIPASIAFLTNKLYVDRPEDVAAAPLATQEVTSSTATPAHSPILSPRQSPSPVRANTTNQIQQTQQQQPHHRPPPQLVHTQPVHMNYRAFPTQQRQPQQQSFPSPYSQIPVGLVAHATLVPSISPAPVITTSTAASHLSPRSLQQSNPENVPSVPQINSQNLPQAHRPTRAPPVGINNFDNNNIVQNSTTNNNTNINNNITDNSSNNSSSSETEFKQKYEQLLLLAKTYVNSVKASLEEDGQVGKGADEFRKELEGKLEIEFQSGLPRFRPTESTDTSGISSEEDILNLRLRSNSGGHTKTRHKPTGKGGALNPFYHVNKKKVTDTFTMRKVSDSEDRKKEATAKENRHFLDLTHDGIHMHEELGCGATTRVYRCSVKGFCCAVKIFWNVIGDEDRANIEKEILIMRRLNHENIAKYLGFTNRPGESIMLFLEYYPKTLKDLILRKKKLKEDFSLVEIVHFSLQIAQGLVYLHSLSILHRDLKSENIFVVPLRDKMPTLCIGDFGESRFMERNIKVYSMNVGTNEFRAPEVYGNPRAAEAPSGNKPNYSEAADIWSFGMVLFELIALEVPYHNVDRFSRPALIEKGIRPNFPKAVAPPFQNPMKLYLQCTELAPDKRLTASELVKQFTKLQEELHNSQAK